MSRAGTYVLAIAPTVALLGVRAGLGDDLAATGAATYGLHVLDVVENGNWILPQAHGTVPASGPPLYAWLAALVATLGGGVSEAVCRVPSALTTLALSLAVFQLGMERWNARVGIVAAWLLACSQSVVDQATAIGPAMLAALWSCLLVLALHRAGRGEARGTSALFWWSAALSMLTGFVGLAALILLIASIAWLPAERRTLRILLRGRGAWALAAPLAWGALAYGIGGSPWVTEVLGPALSGRGADIAMVAPPALQRLPAAAQGAAVGALAWPLESLLASAPVVSLLALCALGCALDPRTDHRDASLRLPLLWLASGLLALVVCASPSHAALVLVTPALVLLAAAFLARRPLHALPPLRAAAAAVAVSGALCSTWLARPEPRSEYAQRQRAFATEVLSIAGPGGSLRIAEGVGSALYVLLGRNDAPLSLLEMQAYDRPTPGRGRALLVCGFAFQRELADRWPERFRPLLERSLGRGDDGLALLEDLRSKPTATTSLP